MVQSVHSDGAALLLRSRSLIRRSMAKIHSSSLRIRRGEDLHHWFVTGERPEWLKDARMAARECRLHGRPYIHKETFDGRQHTRSGQHSPGTQA